MTFALGDRVRISASPAYRGKVAEFRDEWIMVQIPGHPLWYCYPHEIEHYTPDIRDRIAHKARTQELVL